MPTPTIEDLKEAAMDLFAPKTTMAILSYLVASVVLKRSFTIIGDDNGFVDNVSMKELSLKLGSFINKITGNSLDNVDPNSLESRIYFLKTNLTTTQLHDLLKVPEAEIARQISKRIAGTTWGPVFGPVIENEARLVASIIHTKMFPKDGVN